MQVISGIPLSSSLVQVISGIPPDSTLVQVFDGIPQSPTLVQVISGDSSKFYLDTGYQWDSSKFYSDTSYQRNFNSAAVPCRNHQKRLSPVTGAAFPASVRAPISCQSLRLALTGSNSEALWQQLAQTSSRKPCNVPGHELFSAFFRAGNFAARSN